MLRTLLTLTLGCAVLTTGPAIADVYKYTDEHGNVLYTDKPSTLPAERLNVHSQRTDVVAVQARQEAEMKRLSEQEQARQQAATTRAEASAANAASAKDKTDQCTKARERHEMYASSQRLFEQLPNGERRYLSDQELDAARAAAKATMEVMCK